MKYHSQCICAIRILSIVIKNKSYESPVYTLETRCQYRYYRLLNKGWSTIRYLNFYSHIKVSNVKVCANYTWIKRQRTIHTFVKLYLVLQRRSDFLENCISLVLGNNRTLPQQVRMNCSSCFAFLEIGVNGQQVVGVVYTYEYVHHLILQFTLYIRCLAFHRFYDDCVLLSKSHMFRSQFLTFEV